MKLFHAYTACSRVTLTALEQVGVAYDDHMIDFQAGENRSEAYLAINPQGKVPALVVDGKVLTENAAIMRWLHAAYPDAGLFPKAETPWDIAQQLSDLFWLSASWHPYGRAVKVPFLWTTGDVEPVRERGRELLDSVMGELDARLEGREWWYGDQWSIVDSYFWWACVNSELGGYDLSRWANIARHRTANEAQPQLQRALAREQAALRAMEARRA